MVIICRCQQTGRFAVLPKKKKSIMKRYVRVEKSGETREERKREEGFLWKGGGGGGGKREFEGKDAERGMQA